MLDAETKARIDSARDILVGKVPDPKSQVEQITIALIYKFMDDMDRQSEELGGKATFFTGDFKKYRWANLLDKRLGGHERLLLYAEGIEKMNENKNIPQLFRDIFKGVFLPYRDPETLNLFLKEVNGFSYDHSERLGDAFEYLLSVLGTQGDAGQFRTPRHIIDFIVAVVDPQKHETVLDPACGTAGFLVSAFKHILRNNENLTPDERARLMTNFRGYDIAPDMVRLSRANLYLHGFPNPVIHEYDTLTSEERWDERCDVILANPPFMSPKGGIRPHNRFSIKAKRSEVLFVDYMAEHLNPGGRAGIIVPEGIIFQSQNAYKSLRKMLVENYLWAVVSLPAGVFNPYSGVKTSILFLDRNLARRTDELLFVKVETDGFDLGAQRRPNGKNDLPEALEILDSHKKAKKVQDSKMALTVSRKRLLESPHIILSGDRYRETVAVQSNWPMVKLGEVIRTITPPKKIQKTEFGKAGMYPIIDQSQDEIAGWTDDSTATVNVAKAVVIFGDHTCSVKYTERPFVQGADGIKILETSDLLRPRFLFYWLKTFPIQSDGYKRHFSKLVETVIPLPPLAEQEQIVAELDGYRKVIEGARQVIANYKPTIKIDPRWPTVELREVIQEKPKNGYSGKPVSYSTNLKILTLTATTSGKLDITRFKFIDEDIPENSPCRCRRGDIYLQRGNTKELVGTAALFDVDDADFIYPDLMIRVRADEKRILTKFLLHTLQSETAREFVKRNARGAAGSMPKINQEIVERIPIPLPTISKQRELVSELEAERALVEANRELIARFEKKIQSKLAEVWGDEVP